MGISSPKRASANARTLAGIRQLCSLALPPDLVLPKLLEALHRWVPAGSNHFIWSDENGLPSNYYGELSGVEGITDWRADAGEARAPARVEVMAAYDRRSSPIERGSSPIARGSSSSERELSASARGLSAR